MHAPRPDPASFLAVALNYQSEGRMLQLNRAKFSANGSCGYVLKPQCMCQGEDTAPEPPPCWDLEPLPSLPLHEGPRVRRPGARLAGHLLLLLRPSASPVCAESNLWIFSCCHPGPYHRAPSHPSRGSVASHPH